MSRKSHFVCFLFLLALISTTPQLGFGDDKLKFDNNWFGPGTEYAVGGVGLRGTGVNGVATGTIDMSMSGIPPDADPIAAFLYWSTLEFTSTISATDGTFNGNKIRGAVVGNPLNPGCGSSGGTIGAGTPNRTYRADVLRYIPFPVNSNVRQANGKFTVTLPDSGGNGNGTLIYTNGASLVVVYRRVVPGNPSVAPLRAVVAYNGAFSMDKFSTMTQSTAGFYDAANPANAKVTYIVANGQSGSSSSLTVNGTLLSSAPFMGTQGGRWDNFTPNNFTLTPGASSFDTTVSGTDNQTCLTFVAVFASMDVTDSDKDGLLDVWETKGLHRNTTVSPATFGGCSDYPSEPQNCVNLPEMGADPTKPDVFIQLDWMHGFGDGTGGQDGTGFHVHIPKSDALQAVCTAFANQKINVHFDVGKNYQGQPCIVPYQDAAANVLAQGGSDIDESTLLCVNTATHTCDYQEPYPVLSFEFGFASVRDGNNQMNPAIPAHFAQARYWTHHYGLLAHAVAGPFNNLGQPVDPNTGLPVTLPATPLSYSGIAQRPGGGFMVTFGLWRSDNPANDQVGSVLAQAGTIMHELGHNLGLGHLGASTEPNCAPIYPSVMNYTYVTRGLTDAAGVEQVDYSFGTLSPLDETSLSATASLGGPPKYRVRFFGFLGNSPASAAAKLHCDGTKITDGALEVRLESPTVGTTPDWSNGTVLPLGTSFALDVNFNGKPGEHFHDGGKDSAQSDWGSLNFQQIGSGRMFGNLSVGSWGTNGEALATDGSVLATDASVLATDGSVFATDGSAYATDGSAFATDGSVFATDGSVFATDGGGLAIEEGEINQATHNATGPDAPTMVSATSQLNAIQVAWNSSANAKADSYDIYRCAGAGCNPTLFKAGFVPASKSAPTFLDVVDGTNTLFNTTYTYKTLANVSVVVSGAVTITASPLSPNSVSATVDQLVVTADDKSRSYGASNPAFTFTVTSGMGPSPTNVVCTTTATPSSPKGTYPITCTGNDTVSVVYKPGTLTVTVASGPLTITASSGAMTFGGTPPLITPSYSGFVNGDTAASLSTQPTCTTTATSSSSVGPYPSTCIGAADPNYTIKYVPGTVTVSQANQTINFPPPSNVLINSGPVALSATATSGLPVSFASLTPLFCTVSGTSVTPVKAGTCTIRASQAGGGNYNAATPVSQSFFVEDFTAIVSPNTPQTISSGQGKPLTFNFTVTNLTNGLTGQLVSITCDLGALGAAGATCAVPSPLTLPAGGSSVSTSTPVMLSVARVTNHITSGVTLCVEYPAGGNLLSKCTIVSVTVK
jgi:hypothetical protein